ncbi:MAG: hypothetical protein GEV28_38045 [Actinophytocola sp.]|nr:hypothetical protein [Actinophytocola sp.]
MGTNCSGVVMPGGFCCPGPGTFEPGPFGPVGGVYWGSPVDGGVEVPGGGVPVGGGVVFVGGGGLTGFTGGGGVLSLTPMDAWSISRLDSKVGIRDRASSLTLS